MTEYKSDLKRREEADHRRMLERLNRRAPARQAEHDQGDDAGTDDTTDQRSEEGATHDD